MDLGVRVKVALVAAASTGLGTATALELSREGAHVAIAARGEAEVRAAADVIRHATGGRLLAVPADLRNPEDIGRLVSETRESLGPTDILVNNAGGPPPGDLTDVSDDDWMEAIDLNLMSAIRLTRLILPDMRSRGWGAS